MRDRRFVARHRGGALSPADHRLLMGWARGCSARVLPLPGLPPAPGLISALAPAGAWQQGKARVGDAQKAAWRAHAIARASTHPSAIFAARAVGHACATAHMADHSLGAALYALRALQAAGRPIESEKRRQLARLPARLRPLVGQALRQKGRPWGYNGAVRRPAKGRPEGAAMGMINKEWHLANKMPKNPTLEQRMAWHIEHVAHCPCRPMPDKLKAEIAKSKLKSKSNAKKRGPAA